MPDLYPIILTVVLFVYIAFVIFIANYNFRRQKLELIKTVTKLSRGTVGELNLILLLLKSGISEKVIFHDLYVDKGGGKFAQIDLVIATKVGLIVFEVKDYSGWLFGNGKQKKWTKILAYGREKYQFYNPIIQNKGHIEALKKQSVQFYKIPFFSVIVFFGNCQLRDISFIPENTFVVLENEVLEVLNNVINAYEPAGYTDKHEVIRILQKAVDHGDDDKIVQKHIDNLQNIFRC